MSARATDNRPRKRLLVTPRAGLLALIVVALLLYLAVPLKAYLAQRSTLQDLERQTQVLERDNAGLRDRVQELHDPQYVERLARCDGMVRPGEISFVIVSRDGTEPEPDSC
jgi:cell division protein FtsB